MKTHIAIIGAGPAGLTAGYLLTKHNIDVSIIESDPDYVGGIARTVSYKDYCFDIGGHRFFTKSEEIQALWNEILPDDILKRDRSSRIYYRNTFFSYPLKPAEALFKLGPIESMKCLASYCKARLKPIKQTKNFSDWISNNFGNRLFRIFFKTYTEKVWGMPCDKISPDWAAQRIKNLSLFSAVASALPLFRRINKGNVIKSLIDTFHYPRKGPGMLWEACASKITEGSGQIISGSTVYQCSFDKTKQHWHILSRNKNGDIRETYATHLISTAPLKELVLNFLEPTPPPHISEAASQLKYRDFLIVALILKEKRRINDNWIYIHDPHVDVARIQNFKSWSPEMVPDSSTCSYGMEYFCFRNDGLWAMSDEELIAKASREIVVLGLASVDDILDGHVIRQEKAYPVYDDSYQEHVTTLREYLENTYPSLHMVGRNGMHKYNNQDHSMMTAMLTVQNILAGKRLHNIWSVNQDAEYIESSDAEDSINTTSLRDVPQRI